MLQDFPFKYNSREEFVYYLCDLHNKVNKRLNKDIYDCKKAFDIWGSDCGCDAQPKIFPDINYPGRCFRFKDITLKTIFQLKYSFYPYCLYKNCMNSDKFFIFKQRIFYLNS